MATHAFTLVTRPRVRHYGPPNRRARLLAHIFSRQLNARLAAGAPPWQSAQLTARALQLTNKRARWGTARALERLLEMVDEPVTRISPVVPVCREQVWAASDSLLRAAMRLRLPRPVDARGMAMLSTLLSDGSGPCYASIRRDALVRALEEAMPWLEAED